MINSEFCQKLFLRFDSTFLDEFVIINEL